MAAQLRFATRQLEELAIAVRRSCRLLHGRSEHERQVARSHDVPSVGDDFGTGTRVEIRTGVGVCLGGRRLPKACLVMAAAMRSRSLHVAMRR